MMYLKYNERTTKYKCIMKSFIYDNVFIYAKINNNQQEFMLIVNEFV